jgi:penicillin-binding protein 1A
MNEIKKNKRFFTPLFIILLVFLPLFVIVPAIIAKKTVESLPQINQLEDYTPNLSTKIYDKDNNLVAELFTERRMLVPINEIPVNLQNAFIAI